MSKVVNSIRDAILLAGLKDGMTVSFHHHLRNGDYVLNMVMEEIAAAGIRELTVNASSLFDAHMPILEHIRNGGKTALFFIGQVYLGYISRYNGLRTLTEPRQEHLHLFKRTVLSLIQYYKRIVERPSSHICKRCHFYKTFF